MKKEISTEISKTKVFGSQKLAEGVYPVKKLASFNVSFTPREDASKTHNFEALAVCFDDKGDLALTLNGLNRSKPAIKDDGSNGIYAVKAHGTFFDKLWPLVLGQTYFDACTKVNDTANGIVGKFVTLRWREYRSADPRYNNGYGSVPEINIFDSKEEADKAFGE